MELPVTEDNIMQHVAVLVTTAKEHDRRLDLTEKLSDARHTENRNSIHELATGQQSIVDMIHTNHVETIERLGGVEGTMKKFIGYAAGAVAIGGIASGIVVEVVKHYAGAR